MALDRLRGPACAQALYAIADASKPEYPVLHVVYLFSRGSSPCLGPPGGEPPGEHPERPNRVVAGHAPPHRARPRPGTTQVTWGACSLVSGLLGGQRTSLELAGIFSRDPGLEPTDEGCYLLPARRCSFLLMAASLFSWTGSANVFRLPPDTLIAPDALIPPDIGERAPTCIVAPAVKVLPAPPPPRMRPGPVLSEGRPLLRLLCFSDALRLFSLFLPCTIDGLFL